ncbi:hypothetical protein QBC37DRAFT_378586 [Rhypophila decipiens]|uniref:Uncharacterized protein n=1 Tax=Rhypophila decipiens TaxID=261697 RepID=A0AAN6XXT6_9PEZI|nr:hypothetical protein QBC37DRAFT_378586 [Rhypophila decipiens]
MPPISIPPQQQPTTTISPRNLMNHIQTLLPRKGRGSGTGIGTGSSKDKSGEALLAWLAKVGLSTTGFILILVFSFVGLLSIGVVVEIWRRRRKAKFIKERQEALAGSWAPKPTPPAPHDDVHLPDSESPGIVDNKHDTDDKHNTDDKHFTDDKHITGDKESTKDKEQG